MIQIERMELTDAPEVSLIEAEIFSRPWSRQGFEDALHMDNVCFLVARDGNTIAGYMGMYLSLDEGEITNVAVKEQYRGKRIGTKLMERMIEEAWKQDLERIVLEVRVSNAPAIHLYEKMGFENLGVRRDFYDLPREDAYIMEKKKG